MNHSAAQILSQYFIAQGEGYDPTTPPADLTGQWPVYTNFQPPEGELAVVVYDTTPETDGRIQRTGKTVQHPGIQLLIRAIDPQVCYDKAFTLYQALEAISSAQVSVAAVAYTISNAAKIRPPLRVGQIQGKDWTVFTVNCLLTIKEFNQ